MEPGGDSLPRQLRRVYAAFMLAPLAYILLGLLAWMMHVEFGAFAGDDPFTMWFMRGGLAISSVVGLVTAERLPIAPGAGPAVRESKSTARPDASPQERALYTRFMLRMAFTESIGIYGLLLFVLGGHVTDLVLWCGISLVVFAWRFPPRIDGQASCRLAVLQPRRPTAG